MMRSIIILLVFIANLFAIDATLEITKQSKFTPHISLHDCSTTNDLSLTYRHKFDKVLVGDFKVSGHISAKNNYIQGDYEKEPEYYLYKEKNIDLLLKYKFTLNPDKSLDVDIKLFDINLKKYAYTNSYHVSKLDRFPFLAHKIAIDVNDYLKAPPINWMEKFVIFSKYTESKQSEIVISDYTLTYQQTIVTGGLNVFPKWANKEQNQFYYTSLDAKPTLYRVNLYTGTKEAVISSNGVLVCSDVSQDGTKLLLTMAPNDQTDIYLYDILTDTKKRLTKYSGIDVSASFVDNEEKIVFVSERLGYPNIFSKKINSSYVERMVYHGKNNNSCSSHKNYIVYVSRDTQSAISKNSFNLYLISTKSDYIRQLTSTGVNQFPKFSKDGESILFIKNYKNQSALGIIRIYYNKTYLFPLSVGRIQSIDW
jgi:TolB protein